MLKRDIQLENACIYMYAHTRRVCIKETLDWRVCTRETYHVHVQPGYLPPAPVSATHTATRATTHTATRAATHSRVSAPASHGSSQSQTPSLYLSTPHQIDSTQVKTPRTLSPCSFSMCCSVLPRTFRRVASVCIVECCVVL